MGPDRSKGTERRRFREGAAFRPAAGAPRLLLAGRVRMGEDYGEREEEQGGEEGRGEVADPPSGEPSADKQGRIQAGKRREVQVQRTGKRKYFDEAAQAEFLEW